MQTQRMTIKPHCTPRLLQYDDVKLRYVNESAASKVSLETIPMPVTSVGGASRTLPTGLFNEGQSKRRVDAANFRLSYHKRSDKSNASAVKPLEGQSEGNDGTEYRIRNFLLPGMKHLTDCVTLSSYFDTAYPCRGALQGWLCLVFETLGW